MAKQTDAMTPEAAVAAIAEVGEYRQGLTARAAGMIWMVWGLLLALFSVSDMVLWAGGGGLGFGLTEILHTIYLLVVVATGILLSHSIWKSQALVGGEGARFWVVAGLAVAGFAIGVLLVNMALVRFVDFVTPGSPDTFYSSGVGFVAVIIAATITWLQRRRVGWIPGAIAAAVALGLQIAFPYLVGPSESMTPLVRESMLTGALLTITFALVGLWHFRRG